MPEHISSIIDLDNKTRGYSGGFTGGTLSKTASYTITKGDVLRAGGFLTINITAAAADVDITLPEASTVAGCRIRMYKPSGNTNDCAFLATGGDTIEGGTANKRFENVTNENGCCEIWSDGANWRVASVKGTWVADNV